MPHNKQKLWTTGKGPNQQWQDSGSFSRSWFFDLAIEFDKKPLKVNKRFLHFSITQSRIKINAR